MVHFSVIFIIICVSLLLWERMVKLELSVITPLCNQKGQADSCESKNSCLETYSSSTSNSNLLECLCGL